MTRRQRERRLQSEFRSISPYRNIVPTQLLCQIEANPPRIDFPGTIIQVQKEKLNFVFASIRCP